MRNATWGNYVLATTHRDWKGGPYPGYGWSEDCENFLCQLARMKGWTVYEDMLSCVNRDWPGRWDGEQFWQCDGWGSKVILP